jgi:serine protease AprX
MLNITQTVGARALWTDGAGRTRWTGKGVDVAVLDSGVTPVPGLSGTGKVFNGPDLSTDSQLPRLRHLDGYGHGTHMAGIIAGRDTGANPAATGDTTSFLGVAPDARVVNVKVADALGGADVSQIIAGIDWVVQHRRSGGLNIRILNLSLGTPSQQPYSVDPLAYAAEQAWHQGIVVVAAAGNDGTGRGTLLDPAQDPYLLAVGANDTRGTTRTTDDVVPAFSTRGDGKRNPDLVAHGASVQSLRVPGSFIDQQFGATAVVGGRFLRGSGTSQAAAVTSGAVALLLQRNPALTPDEVKGRLTGAARALPAANAQAQGHGMLDLRRVSASPRNSARPQSFARSTGTGSLDASRGGYLLTDDRGSVLTGERDIFGAPFDAGAHAALSAGARAWTSGSWNGNRWTGDAPGTDGWAGAEWSAPSWSGTPWTGRGTGATWTSRTWADGYWSSRTWASRTWASRTWASGGWH